MRGKIKIWSEDLQRWRVVYVRHDQLMSNITLLKSYGIKFLVD